MKTAVSLPDSLYEDAEETAKSLGIPRSRLYARALEEFIQRHKSERITEELDAVYSRPDTQYGLKNIDAGLSSLRELTEHDSW